MVGLPRESRISRPVICLLYTSFRDGEAEDVLDLRGENHHGNAGGKSRGDGEWNEADKRPHAAEALSLIHI